MVRDSRGKIPRFVIFKGYVVNQHTGVRVPYKKDWMPAYLELYKQYLKDGL